MTTPNENDIKGAPNGDDHDAKFDPRPKWPFWIGISGRFRRNAQLGACKSILRAVGITHPALLVVDEIGYLPVNQDGAVLFFQLINARHEKASTVLTSNKGFEDWGGVLGGEVMTAALIDRLVHHCHIVNIRGNSYRMKDHQNLLQSGSDRRRKRAAE